MASKHEIIGLKDQGDKNHVDENVSVYGNSRCDKLINRGSKWSDL